MKNLPLKRLNGKYRKLLEILRGESDGAGFYEAAGRLLGEESALLKVGDDRSFTVAIEVEGVLYAVGEIPVHQINADDLTVFPDSPQTQKRKEAEAERRRMSEAERFEAMKETYRGWGCDVSDGMRGVKSIRRHRNHPDVKVV